jgi:hypothetical protein
MASSPASILAAAKGKYPLLLAPESIEWLVPNAHPSSKTRRTARMSPTLRLISSFRVP